MKCAAYAFHIQNEWSLLFSFPRQRWQSTRERHFIQVDEKVPSFFIRFSEIFLLLDTKLHRFDFNRNQSYFCHCRPRLFQLHNGRSKKNLLANFDTIVPNVNCLFAYYKVGSRDYGRLVTSIRGIESKIKKNQTNFTSLCARTFTSKVKPNFRSLTIFRIFFCIRKNPLSYLAAFHYHYHEYASSGTERNQTKQISLIFIKTYMITY